MTYDEAADEIADIARGEYTYLAEDGHLQLDGVFTLSQLEDFVEILTEFKDETQK